MVKPKLYKAKLINSDHEIVGVYYPYPETTYCFEEDYANYPVKIKHTIIKHQMTDWGLPNCLKVFEIDPTTLEEIKDEDVDKILVQLYGKQLEIFDKTTSADKKK